MTIFAPIFCCNALIKIRSLEAIKMKIQMFIGLTHGRNLRRSLGTEGLQINKKMVFICFSCNVGTFAGIILDVFLIKRIVYY